MWFDIQWNFLRYGCWLDERSDCGSDTGRVRKFEVVMCLCFCVRPREKERGREWEKKKVFINSCQYFVSLNV